MAQSKPVSGSCLCGAVKFRAVVTAPEMDVCHCSMCRRWSGGTFMAVPCDGIEIADATELGVYASSEWGQREFCRSCGSSLFWRMRDGSHSVVSLQALDDVAGLAFKEEIFIDEKPALYAFAGERPRLTRDEFLARVAAMQGGTA
jgi:hypothetical protein